MSFKYVLPPNKKTLQKPRYPKEIADESWALALLNECEQMDRTTLMQPSNIPVLKDALDACFLDQPSTTTAENDALVSAANSGNCLQQDSGPDEMIALSQAKPNDRTGFPVSSSLITESARLSAIERQRQYFQQNTEATRTILVETPSEAGESSRLGKLISSLWRRN